MASDIRNIESKLMNAILEVTDRKNLARIERKALEEMDEVKNRNTRVGKSPAKNGDYNNRYSVKYAKRYKNGALSPVTLRNRSAEIENTIIKSKTTKSVLNFRNKKPSEIFNYIDKGTATGNKIRQIYPKSIEQMPDSVTKVITDELIDLVRVSIGN